MDSEWELNSPSTNLETNSDSNIWHMLLRLAGRSPVSVCISSHYHMLYSSHVLKYFSENGDDLMSFWIVFFSIRKKGGKLIPKWWMPGGSGAEPFSFWSCGTSRPAEYGDTCTETRASWWHWCFLRDWMIQGWLLGKTYQFNSIEFWKCGIVKLMIDGSSVIFGAG